MPLPAAEEWRWRRWWRRFSMLARHTLAMAPAFQIISGRMQCAGTCGACTGCPAHNLSLQATWHSKQIEFALAAGDDPSRVERAHELRFESDAQRFENLEDRVMAVKTAVEYAVASLQLGTSEASSPLGPAQCLGP